MIKLNRKKKSTKKSIKQAKIIEKNTLSKESNKKVKSKITINNLDENENICN